MQHCKRCGAPIYWLKHHRTGKLAPIDAKPSAETGNLIIDLEDGRYFSSGRLDGLPPELLAGPQLRYTNHFATCPDRERWRASGEWQGQRKSSEQAQSASL